MGREEDEYQSPLHPKCAVKQPFWVENAENRESIISPRFRSAAAMAGWDEEALLVATLIVEDTPERESNGRKRLNIQFKTPTPTNSSRKRKFRGHNPSSIPVIGAIKLDDDNDTGAEAEGIRRKVTQVPVGEEKKNEGNEGSLPAGGGISRSGATLPCMDRLREELSCAICLEICFEPSTTTCGHSFCKKCLKSAADKCGKRCPKCRQLISNGRSCTVNTVLWNTIQLLFPDDVEAKKAAAAAYSHKDKHGRSKNAINNEQNATLDSNVTGSNGSWRRTRRNPNWVTAALTVESNSNVQNNNDRRRMRWGLSQEQDTDLSFQSYHNRRRMRGDQSQEDDAALAFQLQRQEFMDAFGESSEHRQPSRTSFMTARARLRALASRSIHTRSRD